MLRYISQAKMLESLRQTQIRDLSNDDSGKITIVTSHYMIRFLLPPLLAAFHERYSGVHIELIDVGSKEANALFGEGNADLCISPIKIESANVACWPIYQDSFLFCVPNRVLPEKDIVYYEGSTYGEYLSKHSPAFIDINILRDVPFITLEAGSGTYSHFKNIFDDARITPQVFQTVEQISTANALANSGLGATLTSKPLVWYTMNSQKVTFFQYDSPRMSRNFYLMFYRSRYISKAVRNFLEICKEHIASELPGYQYKYNLYDEK